MGKREMEMGANIVILINLCKELVKLRIWYHKSSLLKCSL
jgi:hypothetical protein